MTAPGKTMLKVACILFIIYGGIMTILSALGFVGSVWLARAAVASALMRAASVFALAGGSLDLVLGIVGLPKCNTPQKYKYFVISGIVICALHLVTIFIQAFNGSFRIVPLLGFIVSGAILPGLFIGGGFMNKGAVES
jgi:hypothetical protein